MEGFDMRLTCSRLKILGYLTLHTRQLDMIMNNRAQVNFYLKKLTNDIDSILARDEAAGAPPSPQGSSSVAVN
jgi:pyruvate,water dikinase